MKHNNIHNNSTEKPSIKMGVFKHHISRKNLSALLLTALFLILAGTAYYVIQVRIKTGRNKVNQAVQELPPTGSELIKLTEEEIANNKLSEQEAVDRLVDAAGSYLNTYQYDKVIAALEDILKKYPAAADNISYNIMAFDAYKNYANEPKAIEHAKAVVRLEQAGNSIPAETPASLVDKIKQYAAKQ